MTNPDQQPTSGPTGGEHRSSRLEAALDRGVERARHVAARGALLLANPVRVLLVGVCVLLLAIAVPLLVDGTRRLDRAWSDWRHDASVRTDWVRADATVTASRAADGLLLRLAFRDADGNRRRAEARVDSSREWVTTRLPIRYDPRAPARVELVSVEKPSPVGRALVAGAAIGAGFAALVGAVATWRRRRLLVVCARPLGALRVPLAVAGILLALGLAAWAVGTVTVQGWGAVAARLGDVLAAMFSDFLGVLVPVVAFAAGCLLTAWLARHRHHDEHEGFLSRTHRLIDRAAGYVPSPDELASGPDPGTRPTEPTEPVASRNP